MRTALFTLGLLAMAPAAMAQQIAPVMDREAAAACKPDTLGEAIACLDQHLKPEVKDDIRAATIENLGRQELYVGLWVRNNWDLWFGGDLAQWFVANDLPQVERMSQRVIDAYWLHTQGCEYDWSVLGYTVGGIDKAVAGENPCSLTLAEANRVSMRDSYHFTLPDQQRGGGRRGGSADNLDFDGEEEDDVFNPNQ